LSGILLSTGISYEGELLINDGVILPFRHSIPVDEDVIRQLFIVLQPEIEPGTNMVCRAETISFLDS
jgi:hypothetical protein